MKGSFELRELEDKEKSPYQAWLDLRNRPKVPSDGLDHGSISSKGMGREEETMENVGLLSLEQSDTLILSPQSLCKDDSTIM